MTTFAILEDMPALNPKRFVKRMSVAVKLANPSQSGGSFILRTVRFVHSRAARVKELVPQISEAWITVQEADRYYWAMPRLQPLVIAQLAKLGSTNQLLKVVKSRRIRCEKCEGMYTLNNRAQWHDHLILHRCYAEQQFSNRYGKVEV
jgi:hypothetical protein